MKRNRGRGGITVEPLKWGRRKKAVSKELRGAQAQQFREMSREFRAFGKILCIHGEGFNEKLNGAIAVGLAEVCDMLAEVAEKGASAN